MSTQASRISRVGAGVLPVNPVAGDDIRPPIAERLAFYNCPGVSVCVIENGQVGEAAGFGHIEVGGAPVQADTVFAGASISKPVTAVLAMQLVERGLVDLDAPINRYLKRWQLPENDFTRATPVTLRHLLSHQGGTTVHGFGAHPRDLPAPTLLDVLTGRPPSPTPAVEVDKPPGLSVRYSGGGTQIVQLLLEDVEGVDFADLAMLRIFAPLEMSRTTFEQPLPAALEAFAAVGHDANGNPIAGRTAFTPQLAAGGIYTTAPDYARFMVECRKAWLGEPNILMNQQTAQQMMTRQGAGQFGLGWEIFGEGDTLRFGHGGSNAGYQCTTSCQLADGNGAVVLTNGLMGVILHSEVMNTVAEVFEWRGFLKPKKVIQPVPASEHHRYVGRYKIVSGIDAPYLDIWSEDGQLHSYIEGLIFPRRPIYLNENGRFFGQHTQGETAVVWGDDGLAAAFIAYAEGDVEILRAVRTPQTGA